MVITFRMSIICCMLSVLLMYRPDHMYCLVVFTPCTLCKYRYSNLYSSCLHIMNIRISMF